jgi:phage shock protein A
MGVFTRVRDIVNANVNAALDKAEDPEKLVKQMIREMEDTLIEIKAACATAMAQQRKVEREQREARRRADRWAERAEMAVDRGRDDLAREALHQKRTFQDDVDAYDTEISKLAEIVGAYKDDIVQIEEKLNTARERQRLLVQRHIHAVQKQRVQRDIRRVDASSAIVRFEAFTERIDRAEAESELVNYGRRSDDSLEGQFRKMERDEDIEIELNELKQRRTHREPALA